jgi:hypothetical protein
MHVSLRFHIFLKTILRAAVAVRLLPPSQWHNSPPCDPDDSDYEADATTEALGSAAEGAGKLPLPHSPSL